MTYDKAIEEIKEIFSKHGFVLPNAYKIWEETTKQLDKDLSDFLKRFEEGTIEANREAIEEQAIENYEPQRDESRD